MKTYKPSLTPNLELSRNLKIEELKVPSQDQAYLQFLKQNNIDPSPLYLQNDLYNQQYRILSQKYGEIDEQNQYNKDRQVSRQSLMELRKIYGNKFRQQISLLKKNYHNTQKSNRSLQEQHIQSQLYQQKLQEQLISKKQKASRNKQILLKKKISKIACQRLKWQLKNQQSMAHKKNIKKSQNMIQKWKDKLQLSCDRKKQIMSRASSASSIHNRKVEKTLEMRNQIQKNTVESNLLLYQNNINFHSRTHIFNNYSSTSKNHSDISRGKKLSIDEKIKYKNKIKYKGYTSSSQMQIRQLNKQRLIQNEEDTLTKTIAKNIAKQEKIQNARTSKKEKEDSRRVQKSLRQENIKSRMNQNIKKILSKLKDQQDKLNLKHSPKQHQDLQKKRKIESYENYYTPLNEGSNRNQIIKKRIKTQQCILLPFVQPHHRKDKDRQANIYLTEISERSKYYSKNSIIKKNDDHEHKKSVQEMMKNYQKHASKHSRRKSNRINTGENDPREFATKYNREIMQNLRGLAQMVHAPHTKIQHNNNNSNSVKINYKRPHFN